MRRRILLWHWGRHGGGPRYTCELARALGERDDVVTHLSYSRQSDFAAEFAGLGLPTFPVDTYTGLPGFLAGSLRLPLLRRRFAAYLREQRIDTVVCTMGHLWNVALAPVIRQSGARYLLTLHDAVLHPGEESHVRAFCLARELAVTDGVITLTRHVRDQFLAHSGYPRERTWILPHGVFASPGAAPRRYPDGRFRLLFFGRILPYKGFDLLVGAYEALAARYGGRLSLHVAGKGDLAPFADALARLPNVTVRNDWIPEADIPGILEQADLVVLPYREASQSGVAPAAYGAGLPVVVTPVGGLTEQVVDGVTGRLAAAVSAGSVAEAVADVIERPDLYERLSAGAFEYAARELSWEAIAAGLVSVVERAHAAP